MAFTQVIPYFRWPRTTPWRSTHRGTWIRRNIKESTSVSLSGSPLNICSFFICAENKDRGRSVGAPHKLYFFSYLLYLFIHHLWKASHTHAQTQNLKHTHLLCIRKQLQQVFEQLRSVNLPVSLLNVFNNGAVGPGSETAAFHIRSIRMNWTGVLLYSETPMCLCANIMAVVFYNGVNSGQTLLAERLCQ